MVDKDYFKRQRDINSIMRAMLVDWLVDLHESFKLKPETLFFAVNLIDQYLSRVNLPSREILQLVGSSAIFIASKFEEIYAPTVNDFVYVTDSAYN